jgi:hypothetical protein
MCRILRRAARRLWFTSASLLSSVAEVPRAARRHTGRALSNWHTTPHGLRRHGVACFVAALVSLASGVAGMNNSVTFSDGLSRTLSNRMLTHGGSDESPKQERPSHGFRADSAREARAENKARAKMSQTRWPASNAALRLAFDPMALATQPTPLLPQAASAGAVVGAG